MIPFLILALFISCSSKNVMMEEFELLDGKKTNLHSTLEHSKGAVLVYISPECPLCENYSVTLRNFKSELNDNDIELLGIVSGDYFSKSEIEGFLIKYDLDIPIVLDPDFVLSNHYGATITPEVNLIDTSGILLYSGAIDNWAISLGKKRLTITEHYLEEAVSSFLVNEPIAIKKTKAIGCFIE